MNEDQNIQRAAGGRLRLWPGVAIGLLFVTLRLVLPLVAPDAVIAGVPVPIIGMLGALACAVAIVLWWLLLSRAPWMERLATLAASAVGFGATWLVVDPSISNGMMGMMYPVFAIQLVAIALVLAAVATRTSSSPRRRAGIAVSSALACSLMALVRTGGISGDGNPDLHWRWTPTPEQRLLAAGQSATLDSSATSGPATPAAPVAPIASASAPSDSAELARDKPVAAVAPVASASAPSEAAELRRDKPSAAGMTPVTPAAPRGEWSGFRGPRRDGVVSGVQIDTNWTQHPPSELWRHPIGPGWSSFAVHGDLIYTQEQRGEDEMISCYRLSTGQPVWQHKDTVRFWESNGGAGPRATPTLHGGRVYAMGATGLLNALDARTGQMVWSRDTIAETGKEIPGWGIASSPLVVDDLVIVAVAGQLAAYDAATGEARWTGESGGGGYSSPHYATISGIPQVVLLRGARTISVAPASGALLWEHRWQPSVSIVQPAVSADGDVLIASGDAMGGMGMRRVTVAHGESGWSVEERWTSRALKPYFNDFVMHRGHAYGFDGSILACLNIEDGERCWKGGRYGHGQIVLLPDQDVLLVLSEDGELALVQASADRFQELARVPALNGKTWNHPVLVGNVLLVRNGEEMAAFRLPRAGS